MTILMKNLKDVKKGSGFITKVFLVILLVLITCTCSGLKLMSDTQSFANPIEFSSFSGRPVSWMSAHMDCAILRIDDPVFLSWHLQSLYTRPLYHQTPDMVFYRRVALMQRRCLPTRLYRYPLITPFFLDQYRTVWTGPKRNLPTEYRRPNLPVRNSIRTNVPRNSSGLIPRSIGRTPGTTRTMGRSSNFSPTTNRANGRGRTTSSITGGLQKQH